MITSIFSLLYNLFSRSFYVLLIAMLSVNYFPDKLFSDYPFEPQSFDTNIYNSVIVEWNSKITDNTQGLEYIQLNQIRGPESLAFSRAGLLYTGLADGRLVELDPMNKFNMREVLRFNKKASFCKENMILRSDDCGRFLQVRFDTNDNLYAMETNHGLYKVDTKRSQMVHLGPKQLNKNNLYNGFAFDPVEPNIVYMTTSSTRWRLSQIMWSLLELDNSGQIIAFDTTTGKRVILLDKLRMPNGLDIDGARDQIVFSQTTISQINSLTLSQAREAFKAAKDGETVKSLTPKVLIQVVPGNPDNINVVGDVAYIALPFVRPNGKDFVNQLSDKPSVRKAIGRIVFGAGKILEFVHDNVFKHPLLESVYRQLKSGHFLYYIAAKDTSGYIEYNLATHGQRFLGSDKFAYISEAKPDGLGNVYLASYDNSFIVKIRNPSK